MKPLSIYSIAFILAVPIVVLTWLTIVVLLRSRPCRHKKIVPHRSIELTLVNVDRMVIAGRLVVTPHCERCGVQLGAPQYDSPMTDMTDDPQSTALCAGMKAGETRTFGYQDD